MTVLPLESTAVTVTFTDVPAVALGAAVTTSLAAGAGLGVGVGVAIGEGVGVGVAAGAIVIGTVVHPRLFTRSAMQIVRVCGPGVAVDGMRTLTVAAYSVPDVCVLVADVTVSGPVPLSVAVAGMSVDATPAV
ncbi:MAG: hypothetical protein KGQ88_06630, partial [Chloroflexi bacterium]|nr:hypothetical protein [Chloroflexota bacterium]